MTASRAPAATGRLTRVTLVGPHRRADLVLPSDEPIGMLLPEIIAMVGSGPAVAPRAYQLSMLDGRVIEPAASLRSAGVTDGTLIRVDPVTEAPPAPIVLDVSDEIADDLTARRGRWSAVARRWTATAAVAVAALLAALLATPYLDPAALIGAGAVLLAAGTAVAMLGSPQPGLAVLLGGAAMALTAVPWAISEWWGRGALWAFGAGLTMLAAGLATGNHRAGMFGAGTVLVLLVGWVALAAAGLTAARTAAIMAVVSVAALGLLPRLAMLASGLTSLEDRQADDEPVTRIAAESAVDAAHRGLALGCVAAAVSGAVAGWLLAAGGTGWTVTLACLLGLALLLRLRAYPLTIEVACLVAAALVVVAGLVYRWMQAEPDLWLGGVAVAGAVAVVGLVVLGYEPPPHTRARARQLADRLEGLAVIGLIPVAVGVFGVYSRLLDTF
ncbi:MAG: type VII secretion integral membrane protein EccD [Pseudonocardiaceae bacterium]|nr:type VII secretion integral membrane protein EccD [Pseudonocardiaceae bacterium]